MSNHATTEDVAAAMAPKSDQLNADDLATGPRDVQIAGTSGYTDGGVRKVQIRLTGYDRVWRPCKTVVRLLVACWGNDTTRWIDRWARIYNDPAVRFGGVAVGGIRVSHVSGIDGPVTAMLTTTRSKRAPHRVEPMDAPTGAPRRTLDEVLTGAGLTIADFDGWRTSEGKPGAGDLSAQQCDRVAAWFDADPTRLGPLRIERDPATGEAVPDDIAGAS